MIVAFGHKSRVGKDSAANFLVTWLSLKGKTVHKTSFAAKLKQVTHIMYAWAGVKTAEYYEKNPDARLVIIPALSMTYIDLLVELGTKLIRDQLHKDTWINAAVVNTHDFTIITDCRFWNEVVRVHSLGGILIKVIRPGFEGNDSVADNALNDYDGWDYEIVANNLQQLNSEVEIMAQDLGL